MGIFSSSGTRALVTLLVTASSFTGTGRAAPLAPHCATGPMQVYTFTVETRWDKKRYSPGDTVKVVVHVSRPAGEDPLREDLPWPIEERVPVEGALVSTALSMVFPPVGSYGETDADGKVTIKFKLPRNIDGAIDSYTRASKYYATGGPDCTDLEEWGGKADVPAFVVSG
jgi:hypothetical protein